MLIWILVTAALEKDKGNLASFCERKHEDLFTRRLLNRKVVRFVENVDTMTSTNLAVCCRKIRAKDLEYYCTHLTEELQKPEEDLLVNRSTAKRFCCMICYISQYARKGLFWNDCETIRPVLTRARKHYDQMPGKESRCIFQSFPKDKRRWR